MNLPALTIPDIPLPFEIPAMMHPAIVHFAVALPVVILLLEIINLIARRRSIGSISFLLIILMAIVYLGAYLTGSVDANNAKDALSPEAKTLLDAHKGGGIWMVYSAIALVLIKLVSAAVNKFPIKVVFLILMGLFFWGATSVVQNGCALTYKHGVNVKIPTGQAASEAVSKVAEDVKEKAAEVKEKVEQVTEKAKEKTQEAVDKVKEAAETTKEKASEAVEKAKETVEKTVETVKEKAAEVKEKAKDAIEKSTQPTPVVETVPAG
jgi:uncharacterized membrane protein